MLAVPATRALMWFPGSLAMDFVNMWLRPTRRAESLNKQQRA